LSLYHHDILCSKDISEKGMNYGYVIASKAFDKLNLCDIKN
jgi:hypothetical protein